jgi:opacity protein-like surface antigen
MRRRSRPAMSIVKRVATWLAVLVAAATTATVVTASPSFAATVPTNALSTATVGYGYFNADTQVLSIHDSHADGYGVVVVYYRYDLAKTGPYYAWNREGNGTTTYVYFHMAPLAEIKIYACPEKGGIALTSRCGSPAFGYAGTII